MKKIHVFVRNNKVIGTYQPNPDASHNLTFQPRIREGSDVKIHELELPKHLHGETSAKHLHEELEKTLQK